VPSRWEVTGQREEEGSGGSYDTGELEFLVCMCPSFPLTLDLPLQLCKPQAPIWWGKKKK